MARWAIFLGAIVGIPHSESLEDIAGYSPATLVTSQNAIDLDQKEFMVQLAQGTISSYNRAMAIYHHGAFSDPIARLTLDEPLAQAIDVDDLLTGLSNEGLQEVKGHVVEYYPEGTTVIDVRYETNEVQDSFVGCQVAKNPKPKYDGCFANSGTLSVPNSENVTYSYDQQVDNISGRTLAGFSTEASKKMEACINCPYVDFQKFKEYYGVADYADVWVNAAGGGHETEFTNGDADFSDDGLYGKFEAMTVATAFMHIWMYVIRELEDALDDCEIQVRVDSGVHAWDEAVAFYTGSLEGTDGLGNGFLTYNLADRRCKDFKVCGEMGNEDTGTSRVNIDVFKEFNEGQQLLQAGHCDEARVVKERIVELMTIPLIQSTLLYAHLQEFGGADNPEQVEAEGATFAATVLPIVHACPGQGATNAAIIYDNLKIGHDTTDFSEVKRAFQRSYECIGITCEQVGGLWDAGRSTYKEKASPCGTDESDGKGLTIGLAVGGAILAGIVVIAAAYCRRREPPTPIDPGEREGAPGSYA